MKAAIHVASVWLCSILAVVPGEADEDCTFCVYIVLCPPPPVRPPVDGVMKQMVHEGKCTNSCKFARDGTCDDRRNSGVCPDGTDCQDCGPWGSSNFTQVRVYIFCVFYCRPL